MDLSICRDGRTGLPEQSDERLDLLPTKLSKRVEVVGDCWAWTGSLMASGHGQIEFTNQGERHHWMAHRLIHTILVGDPGENLHHECDNKPCVRPSHLTPMSIADHQREHFTRTHCKAGHSLDDAYIIHKSDGRVVRHCRTCKLDRAKRYRLNA